jgi:octanoyl-[GcvH]:protein N-octanoyltransferase/lipoyl amidotransferase
MNTWKEQMNKKTFRYMDHTELESFESKPYTAISSFAIDDAIATSVSEKTSPPSFRAWVHPDTLVLGIPDGRLPFIEEGVALLRGENYDVMIRNSGGLAVLLDENVLNLSLVLPDVNHLSIHDAYEMMLAFVREMFQDLTDKIEAYEIVGSYCPGDFDLSINGRKFAGISQRRIKDAAAIQIYLDVAGDSRARAELVKTFYEVSKKDAETSFHYPAIVPEVMGSLSDLLQIPLTVDEVKERATHTLEAWAREIIVNPTFSLDEKKTFEKRYEQMIKRNERIQQNES